MGNTLWKGAQSNETLLKLKPLSLPSHPAAGSILRAGYPRHLLPQEQPVRAELR